MEEKQLHILLLWKGGATVGHSLKWHPYAHQLLPPGRRPREIVTSLLPAISVDQMFSCLEQGECSAVFYCEAKTIELIIALQLVKDHT